MKSFLISINQSKVHINTTQTIFQICVNVGIYIPHFCYNERLPIAGNCRMCIVEVLKSPKPVVSCAVPVFENMAIFTESPLIQKARESILEFILLNHPIDCAVCDQSGECDLQEKSLQFGSDMSRTFIIKNSLEDKFLGPLVKTVMTRCISCTRCVRVFFKINRYFFLGMVGRGTFSSISTYLKLKLKSELSGNIIDFCPVGLLK